ncbi:MAG: hypothetical protein Q8O00_12510 [Holophaga sp.]|nr:hypothetical protein [Holophaga sp.]
MEDVEGGSLVGAWLDGREHICLKAFRLGKSHTSHFLIPLDPAPHPLTKLTLIHKDPEERVTRMDKQVRLSLSEAMPAVGAPDVGQAFINDRGTFLKVHDSDSRIRPFAYIDLATGEVRARQEQGHLDFVLWEVERKSGFFGLFG